MHAYLPYLLEDIKAAERSEEDIPAMKKAETLEEELEEIENWAMGALEEHPFSYYCGLKKEDFPPAHQLSEEDIVTVFRAFEHLLYTWNADLGLPEKLPWKLRYQFMVKTLKEDFVPMSQGFTVFDFCTGYAPECAYGQYCGCKKFWEDET